MNIRTFLELTKSRNFERSETTLGNTLLSLSAMVEKDYLENTDNMDTDNLDADT